MEKKDLIKVENAAIRAAGSRMAKMFQPMGEHEGDKEARCAFYEGFQEGAAFYRLLISRIDDEFANLIEGARLDSGPEEDTHSIMEMCLKNGIPVITTVQKAPGKKETEKLHKDLKNYIATVPLDMSPEEAKKFFEEHTTESEPEEPKNDEPSVTETMEDCIKATPEQCQACDSNEDCPRSCADIENKDAPETECNEHPIEDTPIWMRPMEKIAKSLENLGVKYTREGDDEIHYLRFKRDGKQFTVYFEKQSDGHYKTVLSDLDDKGGQLLWEGIVTGSLGLFVLERKIAELAKDGDKDRHAGVVITAVQGDGKTNQKTVIEPCGESVSVDESLAKLKELSGVDEPVLKEGEIGVLNTDGWVSSQKAIEMTVGNFVIMAKNLDIDDGLGGIAVSDEHPEYGRYYTWDAAVRVAGKIKGWHLPTAEEAVAMNNEAHKDPNPVIFPRTGYLLADHTHNKFMESDLVFWTATDLSGILETPPVHGVARSLCVSDDRARATGKRTLFSVKLFKDKE